MAFMIFSDLDGTLLDHETYSFAAARPALDALRITGTPLILASSKTAAEIIPLREALGFEWCPAIVENGAGVLQGGLAQEPDNAAHQAVLAALNSLPGDLSRLFSGFSQMGIDGIIANTGLPRDQALLAARRCFSEPGLFSGDEEEKAAFFAAIAEQGITARQGGRFLTLSHGADKAGRMREIADELAARDTLVVALGDAPNDIAMLEAADRAFIIANPHGAPVPQLEGEAHGRITRTEKTGPAGWNESILSLV